MIDAARKNTTSPWLKYFDGEWLEPGLGGRASNIGAFGPDLHSDAAHSPTKGTDILTGYSWQPGRGVWIAISRDGLSWSQGDWLEHGTPGNQTLSPYVTIVNEDGTDNAVVGDSFYAYWAFTPRWDDPVCLDVDNLSPQCVCTDTVKAPAPNCGLRRVVRQKVALVAP